MDSMKLIGYKDFRLLFWTLGLGLTIVLKLRDCREYDDVQCYSF